jgi:hypothetical protein
MSRVSLLLVVLVACAKQKPVPIAPLPPDKPIPLPVAEKPPDPEKPGEPATTYSFAITRTSG